MSPSVSSSAIISWVISRESLSLGINNIAPSPLLEEISVGIAIVASFFVLVLERHFTTFESEDVLVAPSRLKHAAE